MARTPATRLQEAAVLAPLSSLIVPNVIGGGFWGATKEFAAVGGRGEFVNIVLDKPSLFSLEIEYSDGSDAWKFAVTVGVGRGSYVKEFSTDIASGALATLRLDPTFQVFQGATGGAGSGVRLRMLVWGMSIHVVGQLTLRGSDGKVRVNVTPGAGAGAVALASITAAETPLQNANTFLESFVQQNAASTVIVDAANKALNSHGVEVYNESNDTLYLRYSKNGADAASLPGAAPGAFQVRVPPNTTWEMPYPFVLTGINGIWSAAGAGYAHVVQKYRG